MRVNPIRNIVVIKRAEPEDKSPLLFTPDNYKAKPLRGEVLAVGPKVRDVKVCDQVQFPRNTGSDVIVDGAPLILMSEDDVLAVLESDTIPN